MPTTPRTINLPLKLDHGQLSLFLHILDYATFAPTMQLKLKHTSCWNDLSITTLEINLHHYLRTDVQVDSQVFLSIRPPSLL